MAAFLGEGVSALILNYRVEFCRSCYWKQTAKCSRYDNYIANRNVAAIVNSQGECLHKMEVPWLAQL